MFYWTITIVSILIIFVSIYGVRRISDELFNFYHHKYVETGNYYHRYRASKLFNICKTMDNVFEKFMLFATFATILYVIRLILEVAM